MYRISKSQYLKGVQCPKALWLYRHRPDLKPEITESQQFMFDNGHEVGRLAQQYFSNGVEINEAYFEIDKAIASTARVIGQGADTIFEASACSSDGAYSRIDILKKANRPQAWDLIEVKSSTGLKDYYIDDMALQRYAFSDGGYRIRKSFLMHLKNEYVRSGDLDLKKLFNLEDYTAPVNEKMEGVGVKINDLIKMLNSENGPQVEIGDQCRKPFDCDYIPYCWQHVPEYSVYNVFNGRKLHDLLSENIIDIADVPDGFDLTGRQFIAVSAYKKNQTYKDASKIRDFLGQLQYPLYFLDYEAIWPALPLFDKSSPYQQIPFQFSLHIQPRKGGELQHIEFLHTGTDDPRPDFIKSLIKNCGNAGSVVVYNQSYESRINDELGRDFPEYKSDLEKINERMIDLLVPFRSRYLYHPDMKGSATLKSVLPAFAPELSYSGLSIQDGEMASIYYTRCIRNQLPEVEKDRIFSDLKEYCRMDTLAEVKLLEILYRFVK
jgi:hypothetical protein